jgi:hypothetical protein
MRWKPPGIVGARIPKLPLGNSASIWRRTFGVRALIARDRRQDRQAFAVSSEIVMRWSTSLAGAFVFCIHPFAFAGKSRFRGGT